MSKVTKYELSRRRYITIRNEYRRSYGGNQQWFPKESESINDKLIHDYGCGVIAITDLFLYWAITMPNGKKTLAARYLDENNRITKENYMAFVEVVRKKYAFIFGSAGTFGMQLERAINMYARANCITYKAKLDVGLKDLTMLQSMKKMLEDDQPVILMLGHTSPVVFSRLRKKGVPFFKQTRILDPLSKKQNSPYAHYEIARRNVFGHFITITGIIIDDKSEIASQNVMLRITSWGEEYYISYHHLRQYIKKMSKPYLTAAITLIKEI